MTSDADVLRGRTCVFALHVHLVFATKYRRGVCSDAHLSAMQPVLSAVCADFGAALVEFTGEHDHVHLLIEYPPTVQLSRLVNSLKGVSSRALRKRFRMRTHRGHLWFPSYFAASRGGAPLSITRQYVEQPTILIGYPGPERPGLRRLILVMKWVNELAVQECAVSRSRPASWAGGRGLSAEGRHRGHRAGGRAPGAFEDEHEMVRRDVEFHDTVYAATQRSPPEGLTGHPAPSYICSRSPGSAQRRGPALEDPGEHRELAAAPRPRRRGSRETLRGPPSRLT